MKCLHDSLWKTYLLVLRNRLHRILSHRQDRYFQAPLFQRDNFIEMNLPGNRQAQPARMGGVGKAIGRDNLIVYHCTKLCPD